MFRKDNYLGKDNQNIREQGKVIMGLGATLPNNIHACRSEFVSDFRAETFLSTTFLIASSLVSVSSFRFETALSRLFKSKTVAWGSLS